MPTAPKRHARKLNKGTSTTDQTSFATVTRSSTHLVDHICDSAFLAERGIFNGAESQKHAKTAAHHRSGQAA